MRQGQLKHIVHDSQTQALDHQTISNRVYDAVIIGSGVSGSIIANELSQQGYRILILEAGTGNDFTTPGYEAYLSTFYSAVSKDNNAPYPPNRNAPMPRGPEMRRLQNSEADTSSGYFVQNGPFVSDFTYAKVVGGTTMHWEAKTPRMLPDDFEMQTRFGRGRDWPVSYETLMPYYQKAEFEIGVSGDADEQAEAGTKFEPGYVYPMQKIPITYLDKQVAKGLDGAKVDLDGETYTLKVRSYPQGRNGVPNPKYPKDANGKGYVPVGAVSTHQVEQGERCQGNNNCTPICPVQAKYDARKTLFKAIQSGKVDLLPQTVASKVHVDPETGRVTQIDYKTYDDLAAPGYTTGTVRGRIFVLAANAIENARLMLASGLSSSSGLIGRNLMDHPFLLAWGLMPEIAGTMRGTICTSGIADLRNGSFRRQQAAFSVDIHNDGWGWATGSPYTNLLNIVDNQNKFGAALRRELVDQISRQLLLAFMVEMPPEPGNRVTVDPTYTDQLGNPRPVISFNLPDYTLAGIAYARQISRRIFQRIGAEDHTTYNPLDCGYITYAGQGYTVRGGNHLSGTHIMGATKSDSVVDSRQRSWDHKNLFLVGAGSMPSIGTSNTTLTLAALCFMSAETILADLRESQ